MTKIKIAVPGPQESGFLRRQKAFLEYSAVLQNFGEAPNPEGLDKLVEFLLEFVQEPQDRKEASEALWDASQEQFEEILKALSDGMTANVPNSNSGASETST